MIEGSLVSQVVWLREQRKVRGSGENSIVLPLETDFFFASLLVIWFPSVENWKLRN